MNATELRWQTDIVSLPGQSDLLYFSLEMNLRLDPTRRPSVTQAIQSSLSFCLAEEPGLGNEAAYSSSSPLDLNAPPRRTCQAR
jgi:hypothetical protein